MFFIVSSVESLTRTEYRLSTSINHVIELYGTMQRKCAWFICWIIKSPSPSSTILIHIDQPMRTILISQFNGAICHQWLTDVDRLRAWPWGLRCPHQSQLRADGSAVAGWEFFSFLIKAWENWINWIMNISWICHVSCQLVVVQL